MALDSISGVYAQSTGNNTGHFFDDPAHSINKRYGRGLKGGFNNANAFEDKNPDTDDSVVYLGYDRSTHAELSEHYSDRGTSSIFPTKDYTDEKTIGFK